MAGYFLFFRCWPGFTEPFPFERFNALPDDELGSALNFFAREQLRLPEVRAGIKQEAKRRRQKLLAGIRRQSRRRMGGGPVPGAGRRIPKREWYWPRIRGADRTDPLTCRLGAYLGWWHSGIVGLSGPVVPRIWFHETRSREFAEQLVVELNARSKLAKLTTLTKRDFDTHELEYHANLRPGFISAEGLSDGQRASIRRCIQAIQEGRNPDVEYGSLVLPIGQRALAVALDLAKAWPVEEDKELLATLLAPPPAGKPEQGEVVANASHGQGAPLFVGPPEQLQTLARWLDDFVCAESCEAIDDGGSKEFLVDLRALNKVLAVGNDALGCLNPVDAQRCSGLIGELQRDVAALLAGGLGGVLEPSAEQQQAGTRLRCSLREAVRYFHKLGVRVRARLAEEARPLAGAPQASAGNGGTTGKRTERAGGAVETKPKRSTVKGEAQAKIIGALTLHHKYQHGGCLNLEPIGNNELARLADVSESTASAFFRKKFQGYTKYRAVCGDATRLVAALKLLNQEFSPHHLFGGKPPGEGDRDDEE